MVCIIDPRYLNSFVKGMLFLLLLSRIFGGIILFFMFSLACLRLGGMSMARVFDSWLSFQACIFNSNLAIGGHICSAWVLDSIPSLVVDMKAPSSMYRLWSTESVVPFDAVGCLTRWPCCLFGFLLSGKKLYVGAL